jgi:hypothetical protein
MAFNPSRSGSAYHTTPSHKSQNKHIYCPGLVVVEARFRFLTCARATEQPRRRHVSSLRLCFWLGRPFLICDRVSSLPVAPTQWWNAHANKRRYTNISKEKKDSSTKDASGTEIWKCHRFLTSSYEHLLNGFLGVCGGVKIGSHWGLRNDIDIGPSLYICVRQPYAKPWSMYEDSNRARIE